MIAKWLKQRKKLMNCYAKKVQMNLFQSVDDDCELSAIRRSSLKYFWNFKNLSISDQTKDDWLEPLKNANYFSSDNKKFFLK
jgi:hypothetical protein